MTRINIGVPPKELSRQHLIAEHREIIRIPNAVRKGKAVIKNIPPDFRLGAGHVKFFYDKLEFLRSRYERIYQECIERGFNVRYYGDCWDGVPIHLMNDYKPTESDAKLIRERIAERLKKNNKV